MIQIGNTLHIVPNATVNFSYFKLVRQSVSQGEKKCSDGVSLVPLSARL